MHLLQSCHHHTIGATLEVWAGKKRIMRAASWSRSFPRAVSATPTAARDEDRPTILSLLLAPQFLVSLTEHPPQHTFNTTSTSRF